MDFKDLFPDLIKEAVLAGATVEFWFSEGARTKTEAYERGFLRVGNIIGTTPQMEQQGIDSYASVRGKRSLLKHTETQRRRSYQLDNNIVDLTALAVEYRGDKATAFTQAAYASEAVDAFDFSSEKRSKANVGYPITDGGVRVRQLTSVSLEESGSPLVEDTDFKVDKVHGMVFFLTEQSASITVTVTGDEITEDSELFENAITPESVGTRDGYGSVYIYDEYDPNNIHHRHEDFSCIVRPNAPTQRDSESEEARTQMVVEVTTDPGTVYVRRAASPSGYGS